VFVAALTGLGGGNFASSMTNINAFYPQRYKGWALGLNARREHRRSAVQLIGLLVIWLSADQPRSSAPYTFSRSPSPASAPRSTWTIWIIRHPATARWSTASGTATPG
jgi:nitrate/nitrite transporter NarK